MSYKKLQDEESHSRNSLVYKESNIIYFFDEVCAPSICDAIRYIDYLESNNKVKQITFIITSGGGSAYDGLALYDRLKSCKKPIITIGMGLVASMGFVIYLAGDKRICTKNVSFLNHQIKANFEGSLTSEQIKVEENETHRLENITVDIIAERTLLTPAIIKNHIKTGDKYIGSKEAIAMGISHEIIDEINKEIK